MNHRMVGRKNEPGCKLIDLIGFVVFMNQPKILHGYPEVFSGDFNWEGIFDQSEFRWSS